MSTKIIEKRQQRAQIVKEMRELLDAAETRGGGMTAEDEQKYSRMDTDVDKLGKEIEREERQLDLDSSLEERGGSAAGKQPPAGGELRGQSLLQSEEYRSAFRNFLAFGPGELKPEERSLLNEGRRALASEEARALSVGSTTAGGFTVAPSFYDQLINAMKYYSGMRQASNVIKTDTGASLLIPTVNDTANMGAILGENTAAAPQDVVFGQTTLGAYKYTSNLVLVSIELLQDSAFNIENFLAQKLGERLGRIQNNHFTIGSGTNQPQGAVTGAASGKVGTTGQTTSVTIDDLLDLEHSVDIAYRPRSIWMMHDQSIKAVKKLKDSQGRPLFLPGLALKEPDTINGYSFVLNNDVPVMAANAKSMLFGDFSNYWIRDVMDVMLVRMGEKYADAGQVGFVAFYRGDGKLIDAGSGPIRYYQNSAT